MSLDLTLMPLGEITEELQFWARESRKALAGDLPSSETLRAILALWVAPETAGFRSTGAARWTHWSRNGRLHAQYAT